MEFRAIKLNYTIIEGFGNFIFVKIIYHKKERSLANVVTPLLYLPFLYFTQSLVKPQLVVIARQ